MGVQAQDVTASDETSATLFEEGVAHLREERFRDAARAFRRAYRAEPRVEAMCNLALTYDRWGGHVEQALRAYRTCARDDSTGRFRGYAQRRIEEIERETALADEAPDPVDDPVSEPVDTSVPVVAPSLAEPVTAPQAALDQASASAVEARAEPVLLYIGIGAAGLGLVSLGTAIGLALESGRLTDQLFEELGPSPTVVRGSAEHQRLEQAQTLAAAATGLYVGAAILVALGTTLGAIDLVATRDEGEPALSVTVTGSGMTMAGSF